ncbi:MAG TPA: septal ring lytic transglycosylase RlpA family protein [Thiobacillaceae bacterium]|nr:septal ring lytic transglycosylase RlpA family protein [Thiobacillaceae bacterium]HNF89406.1 septal ring lytic transglycosylase RlpA family protein [Thiobacillaceae bacterium]HNH88850.1 septal ring lytic transglycosylase RlpA family protein [Thiobacillaceae bacterium]
MPKTRPTLLILVLGALLAGCGTTPTKTTQNDEAPVIPPYKGGGYYKDDGPGANPPSNLAEIPDAVPKWEPLHRYANDAYKVQGKEYLPLSPEQGYKAKGLASWYGRKFHGKATSSGEPYDMYGMSAAHTTLPLPSYARVTNLENGKSIIVRVNDRGPFHDGRIIDLSYTAAYKLDILKGVTPVEVESVLPDSAPTSFAAQSSDDFNPLASPKPATALPAAKPAPGNAVYLQLGAFSNPATADGVLAKATAKLSKALPGVMRQEVNGLHKVQAGPFASGEEADRAAERIQAELGIKAYKVAGSAPAPQPAEVQPIGTPPAGPVPAATPSPPPPGLYLQLGAVSSAEAADALASRVRTRFGDSLPGLTQVAAGNLVKVQAGPFASPAAAEQLALAYQQDFGVKPYKINR